MTESAIPPYSLQLPPAVTASSAARSLSRAIYVLTEAEASAPHLQ